MASASRGLGSHSGGSLGIRRRLGHRGPAPVDTDAPERLMSPGTLGMSPGMSPAMSPHVTAMSSTPRSTAGSPLTSHAQVARSGGGDLAAGPRRHNSLSEVEVLPWLCCMTPAICIFSIYGGVFVSSFFFSQTFCLLTAVLTFITMIWFSNLALSASWGVYCMRRDSKVDWNALLEEAQDSNEDAFDVMHIVILPNYQEHEHMLLETLNNLGSSPMALDRVRVVLAMEAREGAPAREKAERLIQKTEHLFADIFATYHPANLPGEVAGKSSNTQYAYREALRHYGPILQGCDLSRVFLTVADADTLWHPQYLSRLTYNGMHMTPEERAWRIWQPPVLLLRNIFTVPAMTRASSHGSLIFELAALGNQSVMPAFAYSSYSLTLALASHPEVDGWDVDVIAEDHHMFCKCYFAALWELAHTRKENEKLKDNSKKNEAVQIVPQLQVQPIFLPAVSYLVESDTYWSSVWARFQQARRHSQGVVELGYVLLQYARLTKETGFFALPVLTHVKILVIALKIHTLHITSTAQCFSCIMGALTAIIPRAFRWIVAGGIYSVFKNSIGDYKTQLSDGWGTLDIVQQVLAASLGQVSALFFIYTFVCFLVIKDLYEGKYHGVLGQPSIVGAMPPVGEDDETAEAQAESVSPQSQSGEEKSDAREAETAVVDEPPPSGAVLSFVTGKYSWLQRITLFLCILNDTWGVGYYAITVYAMIPVCLAAWSLFRRGTDFDYIVAAKPDLKAE